MKLFADIMLYKSGKKVSFVMKQTKQTKSSRKVNIAHKAMISAALAGAMAMPVTALADTPTGNQTQNGGGV